MSADASEAGAVARRTLESMVQRLSGGERRDGQLEMCAAVAEALEKGEHLVVEAGTGVGKSLAYLVPAVLSGLRVVVATARKPLQDQLIRKDIPFVAAALPGQVDAAVLKGRANYLCLAKLEEATGGDRQELFAATRHAALSRLAAWAEDADSGDLADAPILVDSGLRSLVTIGARECPGATACEHGEDCLAERALDRARAARLVVTNIDLYCLDVAIGGALLGEHDAVVIDEAHELEAIATRTFGLEVGPGRLTWLAAQLRGLLVRGAEEPQRLDQAGERLGAALEPFGGRRVDVGDEAIEVALTTADAAVASATEVLRKLEGPDDNAGRRQRGLQAASALLEDLRAVRTTRPGEVAWVPEGEDAVLHVAPIDVGPALANLIYANRTSVLTSATLSVGGAIEPVAERLGLRAELLGDEKGPSGPSEPPAETPEPEPEPGFRGLRVASPFDYRRNAVLYCAAHLPDPRRSSGQAPESDNAARFDEAAMKELAGLVESAGGRTLALFTSHRMLRLAAEALPKRFGGTVLAQDGPPDSALVEQFRDDEKACLLATMGYWQGVDVPGPSLSLVVIDRLPFPRPGDPLLDARREAARLAGRDSFKAVDLPMAATLLAQGAGRLIRSTTDRGVVAVLDRRLARAKYRPALLESLPPMRRTVDGDEVRRFLAQIASGRPVVPSS